MSETRRHLIKKYANRKLYDTRTSRYITLDGISDLLRDGYDIQVVDRETGRDITPVILSQVVTSEEKRTDFADGIERQERGQQLLGYVRGALNVPAAIPSSITRRTPRSNACIRYAAFPISPIRIPPARRPSRMISFL